MHLNRTTLVWSRTRYDHAPAVGVRGTFFGSAIGVDAEAYKNRKHEKKGKKRR